MTDTATQYETVSCNLCDCLDQRVIFPATERRSNDLVEEFKSSADGPLTEQVVECARCDLQYVSPRLRSQLILDGYREGSDERFISQAKARERTFWRALARIERHIPVGRVLDVGTAAGSFLHVAQSRGWAVSGCEPNRWMCEWGGRHYGLTIDAGTINEQRYPDQAFDLVTLWDVLEHDGNPRRLLDECHRVLRPGGLLVVNYPDAGSWIARAMGKQWPMYLSGHLYFFTRKTIADLLRRTRFELVQIRPHVQSLEFAYLLLRTEGLTNGLSQILSRPIERLGLGRWQVPYWIGQTFVMARRGLIAVAPLVGAGEVAGLAQAAGTFAI